jgi:hypothetical protein
MGRRTIVEGQATKKHKRIFAKKLEQQTQNNMVSPACAIDCCRVKIPIMVVSFLAS